MKKFLLVFLVLFIGCGSTLGASAPVSKIDYMYPGLNTTLPSASPVPPPIQPQPIDFINCTKFFKLDSQKLFYLTLAGVNANRFKIDEIQSKSGYVLFTVAQKQFLASVINVDAKNSMLKITPCNNIYYFPAGIVQNMFKYIELNINTTIERLSVF